MLVAQTVQYMHNDVANHRNDLVHYVNDAMTEGMTGGREALKMGASVGAAFGRSVVAATGQAIIGGVGLLNYINPISLTLRHAPSVVSTPLKYVCDEVDGFTNYLLHPTKSMTEVVNYFVKKPIRLARLMQALGVPVDPVTMAALKMENDIEKAEKMAPSMLAGTTSANKLLTANVERLRGKIVLSLVKAAVDGGEEIMEDMIKLIPQLLIHSGERALGKSLVKAGVL